MLEPAPGTAPLWAEVTVTALFPARTGRDELLATLATVPGIAPPTVTFAVIEERDWVRDFREQLAPRRFGERLWICPTEAPCPDPAGTVLMLDPGLAFGSGSHATTAMCLAWLDGLALDGRTVLDWGCGSGVLALAALALGARSATALDIDPQALLATAQNAARNRLDTRLRIVEPHELDGTERYDVVVANILAGSLIELAPSLRTHCEAGARVALSGILATQAATVCEACAPWLDLSLTATTDGWVLLTGTPA